jgi:hypothetical protein
MEALPSHNGGSLSRTDTPPAKAIYAGRTLPNPIKLARMGGRA